MIKRVIVAVLIFIILTSMSSASSINTIINIIEEHKKYIDPSLMKHYIIFEEMIKKALAKGLPLQNTKIIERHENYTYYLYIYTIKEINNRMLVDLNFWIYWKDFDLPFALAIHPPSVIVNPTNISINLADDLFRHHYNIIYPNMILSEEEAWNIFVNYLKDIKYNGTLRDIKSSMTFRKRFVMLEGDEIHLPPSFVDIMSHSIKYNVSAGVWIPTYIFSWYNHTTSIDYYLYISAIDGKILLYDHHKIQTYCNSGNCNNEPSRSGSNYQNYEIIAVVTLIALIITTAIIAAKKFIK